MDKNIKVKRKIICIMNNKMTGLYHYALISSGKLGQLKAGRKIINLKEEKVITACLNRKF